MLSATYGDEAVATAAKLPHPWSIGVRRRRRRTRWFPIDSHRSSKLNSPVVLDLGSGDLNDAMRRSDNWTHDMERSVDLAVRHTAAGVQRQPMIRHRAGQRASSTARTPSDHQRAAWSRSPSPAPTVQQGSNGVIPEDHVEIDHRQVRRTSRDHAVPNGRPRALCSHTSNETARWDAQRTQRSPLGGAANVRSVAFGDERWRCPLR